jgi:DNA-binding phage protein
MILGGECLNNQVLNEKIEESRLSKNMIAEQLGLTRQGLYNKLNGKCEFKGSEIKKLIQMLGLNEHEQQMIFFADDVGANVNNLS